MNRILSLIKLTSSLLVVLLLSVQLAGAQSGCGNISSDFWSWVHGGSYVQGPVTTPVFDCNNPFNVEVVNDAHYPHQITLNGQTVTQGAIIQVPVGGLSEYVNYKIAPDFDYNYLDIEVFRHEGGSYQNVLVEGEPLPEFITGTYTLVSYEGYLTLNKSNRFLNLFTQLFPIAYADEAEPIHTRSITFTVTENSDLVSNVLFLPGFMGSRLFEGEIQRWEGGDSHVQRLYLNEVGQSLNSITAKEVVDTFHGLLNVDIYKSFLADLENYKNNSKITDYLAMPYDWRLSFSDILSDGSIENNLRDLAASSPTGKVSIVAHSKGGLLAKYLLSELGSEAADLVDKLVMVGTPQLGTPKTIGALLHGYEVGILGTLKDERARDIARNMPGMYQLLPFANYYGSVGSSIYTPYVTFDDRLATQAFIDKFGYAITPNELHDFLVGTEGRTQPPSSNLKLPVVGNSVLIKAAQVAQNKIGAWEPPPEIEIHQIAGVGEATLAGIDYKGIEDCRELVTKVVNFFTKICSSEVLSYKPRIVYDGDGTVVAPSALAIGDGEGVSRWWVDLDSYNRFLGIELPDLLRKGHHNLLDLRQLNDFIFKNIIFEYNSPLPQYIYGAQPVIDKDNRLQFILHSPLHLSAVDESGNEIGQNVSQIPGAWYERFGEVQMLSLPKEANPTIYLTGYDEGSFTLEIEEYEADTQINYSVFSGIPSNPDTLARMDFPDGSLTAAGDLIIDYDGDGATDLELALSLLGPVSLPLFEEGGKGPAVSSGSSAVGYITHFEDRKMEIEANSQYLELLKLIVQLLELKLRLLIGN